MNDRIYNGYVECMLWVEDIHSADDISPGSCCDIQRDIEVFVDRAPDLTMFDATPEQIGHDLYLTRNGHGTGFWDRPELYGGQGMADEMTTIARDLGPVEVRIGDDGLVYA